MIYYEIEVIITIKGYECVTAATEAEAVTAMELVMAKDFAFTAPLSNKQTETIVKVVGKAGE